MKNYKFDVKRITKDFNNVNNLGRKLFAEDIVILTNEQMSEMIKNHALKLGYINHFVETDSDKFIFLNKSGSIGAHYNKCFFSNSKSKEIGLEFFSMKPEPKMVTVKMPEVDFINMKPEIKDSFSVDYDKWELVE